MGQEYGKKWEDRFRQDWKKCFPDGFIYRLPDQVSGFRGSQNPCDFLCYDYPLVFFIECKAHAGASVPFDAISQHERLKKYEGLKGVRCGCMIWLYEKDIVFYVPISTITKMKEDGKKSVGLKAIEEGYNIKIVPCEKKKVFMQGDYSFLKDLEDGE